MILGVFLLGYFMSNVLHESRKEKALSNFMIVLVIGIDLEEKGSIKKDCNPCGFLIVCVHVLLIVLFDSNK